MNVTVEILPQEIAALRQLTQIENDADAILTAAREFLRLGRLRELKSASGKVDFDSNWQELDKAELNDAPFPE
jgi:hypothetical protein